MAASKPTSLADKQYTVRPIHIYKGELFKLEFPFGIETPSVFHTPCDMDIASYIKLQLNEEQAKAALHIDTSSLIIAGAGS